MADTKITPPPVVFDLDDTLLNATKAYLDALQSMGISPDHPVFLQARGFVKTSLGPNNVSSHNRLLYFKKYLELKGEFSPEKTLHLMSLYEGALEKFLAEQWQKLGRVDLLTRLKMRFPLAIITNENTRTQMIKLRAIDPQSHFFSFVVTSEEAGVEKPDLRIFNALEKLSGAPSQDWILVGDSWLNDMEPALKLGARAIWSHEFLSEELKKQNHEVKIEIIEKLDELEGMI